MRVMKPSQKIIRKVNSLARLIGNDDGTIKIMSSAFYQQYSFEVLRTFMHYKAYYCLPTSELIDFLRTEIGEMSAIEIGCGHGEMARALDVPATDSKLQEREDIKLAYQLAQQPLIEYPNHVVKLDANEAIDYYNPQVVFGSYITKKSDIPGDGNFWGVDEPSFIHRLKKYIHIGAYKTHRTKPLMELPHTEHNPSWLICRSMDSFIGVRGN